MAAKKRRPAHNAEKVDREDTGERKGMKVGFYLPPDLVDRFRDIAWYERKPASQIVKRLMQQYVDERKRIPKRPKGEAEEE